jgi:probable F420-dependent oxidoreductase
MPAMRFAISIPQFFADGEFDPAAFRSYFARVEQLGYESAWTQESVLSAAPQLGPIETMTYAAACTERIRLGCVVFVSTLHSPVHLAKSIATLDQLSGGRIDVGAGTGGKQRPFAAFGITGDRYVARFTEGVALMKALWTQHRVTFDGEFWQLKDAAMEPKPVQKPHPPVWIGASGEAALRRAVRIGDGFFGAGSAPTPRFAGQVQVVRAGWRRQAAIPAPSRSRSACTSQSTTTPGGAGSGSTRRWSECTAAGYPTSRRPRRPARRPAVLPRRPRRRRPVPSSSCSPRCSIRLSRPSGLPPR